MNTRNRYNTIRSTICTISAGLGMALFVGLAGAQEVAGRGANKDDHAYKGAMKEMSRLKEARVVTVKGNENWDKTVGFGKDSDMIEMMTLMMVGGSGMEHMKMAGMSSKMNMGSSGEMETGDSDTKGMAMDAAQGLPVTVTLKKNPPGPGDNTMDVLVTNASGKPVTGLKLMATVAMTSMDMGTERPKLVEGKDGHYVLPVKFSMKGPWRVMLTNDGKSDKNKVVRTTLDFKVDGATKWIQTNPSGGMKMDSMAKMPGMKMDPAMKMPGTKTDTNSKVAVTKTDTTTKIADTKIDAPANMADMAIEKSDGEPLVVTLFKNPPPVGDNLLDVMVMDGSGKPVTGLKLNATVAMTNMDMGTANPKVKEGKDGHYSVPVKFSMKGPWRVMLLSDAKADKSKTVHSMLDFIVDGKTKWMQPKSAGDMKMSGDAKDTKDMKMPDSAAPSAGWKVTVNSDPKTFKVGTNMLDVTILDTGGKPVKGAKVMGSVEMTSMDMGVTKPKAKEGKDGHYTVPVEFTMKGPWRVTLTVTPPKQKPFAKALDFNVPK